MLGDSIKAALQENVPHAGLKLQSSVCIFDGFVFLEESLCVTAANRIMDEFSGQIDLQAFLLVLNKQPVALYHLINRVCCLTQGVTFSLL